MTSYRVLSGASAKSLEEQVVDLMSEGYVPIGGVSSAYATGQSSLAGGGMIGAWLFSQAMLKQDDTAIPEASEKPDREQWVMERLKTYDQYWDEKQQVYLIIDKGIDVAEGDEIWKPTRDELVADIERSYDFEHGDQS